MKINRSQNCLVSRRWTFEGFLIVKSLKTSGILWETLTYLSEKVRFKYKIVDIKKSMTSASGIQLLLIVGTGSKMLFGYVV